jgi:uncharacterized Zn-binding protein involved in type VI secretion
MLPVSKMRDMAIGICTGHKFPISTIGYIMSTCSTVLVKGVPIARQNDIVLTPCGHIGYIVSASPTITAQGIGVARVGDTVSGVFNGVIIQGSGSVLSK